MGRRARYAALAGVIADIELWWAHHHVPDTDLRLTQPREILMPAQVVNRANHRAWLVPIEDRPLPAWDAVIGG